MTGQFWWGIGLLSPALIIGLGFLVHGAWNNPSRVLDILFGGALIAFAVATVAGIALTIIGLIGLSDPVCGTPEGDAAYAKGNEYCRVS